MVRTKGEVMLTARMTEVLRVLFERRVDGAMPPNDIGAALGFRTGHLPGKVQSNHCGRVMGPAQRVTFALTALRQRGLVALGRRRDGLSGTAYSITTAGEEAYRRL